MPVDIYSAIVGEPPTEGEKLDALAKKLRGKAQLGQLGMLTGDKVLSALGQNIGESTEAQAAKIANRQIVNSQLRNAMEQERLQQESTMARQTQEQGWRGGQNALDRALARELEGMQQSRVTSAESKAEAAATKELARYVERYGKELGKADIPTMQSYISTADSVLSKYDGKSIPGIGFMDFKARMTQEGSDARQAVQAVQNALLKALSGAAVTQSEADRLEKQMFGPLATEESFRKGWSSLKSAIDAKKLNIDKSYDPLVVETYDSRGRGATGDFSSPASNNPEDYDTYEEYLQAQGGG